MVMLYIHLSFALLSIIMTTLTVFLPSSKKLLSAKLLAVGTLVSGTILVVMTQSPILSACVSGIIYLTAVAIGMFAAQRRLVAVQGS